MDRPTLNFSKPMAFLLCLGYIILMPIIQLLGIYVISVIQFDTQDSATLLAQGSQNGMVVALSTITTALFFCTASWLFLWHKLKHYSHIKHFLGWRMFNTGQLLHSLAIFAPLLLLGEIASLAFNQNPMQFLDTLINAQSFWWLIIAIVIIAPIYEEVIFRGVILGALTHITPISTNKLKSDAALHASIITSVLFSCVHWQYNVFGISLILALSLLFCYVRIKFGLLLAIIIHALNNAIAMILYLR